MAATDHERANCDYDSHDESINKEIGFWYISLTSPERPFMEDVSSHTRSNFLPLPTT